MDTQLKAIEKRITLLQAEPAKSVTNGSKTCKNVINWLFLPAKSGNQSMEAEL